MDDRPPLDVDGFFGDDPGYGFRQHLRAWWPVYAIELALLFGLWLAGF